MGVRIDSTGNHQLACGIDGLVETTGNTVEIPPDKSDRRTIDENVGDIRVHSRDHMTVSN